MTPFVSVLVAAYRTNPQHLKACIDSILNQTYTNFELLVLDDCPQDKTVEKVIQSYSDKRIFYRRHKKNLGIAQTRTELMRWAKGKYLAVMDHDDLMMPSRLEKQVAYMEAHPHVGICGTAYRRFGDFKKKGIVRHPIESDEIKSGLFFKCTMHHPSVLIRSEIIKKHKIKYSDEYISANDVRLYLDIMPYAELHNLPEVLMLYRVHPNMTSKQARVKILNEQQKLRLEVLNSMKVHLSEQEMEILNNFVVKGRCRIKDFDTLNQVERVLVALNQANLKSNYFPKTAFSKMCANYLIKRCKNALFYGQVSSLRLLPWL